eukprot:6208238-Pleurochrysis_carterae.AAC.5
MMSPRPFTSTILAPTQHAPSLPRFSLLPDPSTLRAPQLRRSKTRCRKTGSEGESESERVSNGGSEDRATRLMLLPCSCLPCAPQVRSLNSLARTDAGFAAISSVRRHTQDDHMASYFLAETLKYLYLLYDEARPLSNAPRSLIPLRLTCEHGGDRGIA